MKRLKGYSNGMQNDTANVTPTPEQLLNEAKRKFGQMSETELIAELSKSINNGKKDGTINYEQLLNLINGISPYLTNDQRERIEIILSTLK